MKSIKNGMSNMKLKKLIKDLDVKVIKGSKDIEITGISNNSKSIAPGYLFVAKRGSSFDGNAFIHDALLAGASAILTDFYNPFLDNVVQLITPDVAKLEPILGNRFYSDPSMELFLVGVTGTNGKTTSTYLLKTIFDFDGPTGLIGTIERIVGDWHYESNLTTPDVLTCNKFLKEVVTSDVKNAFMEVSSHGLHQKRVNGIFFDIALFTNLTPEHLDYHHTMENYALEKAKLCLHLKPQGKIVYNLDDPWCEQMVKGSLHPKISFALKKQADYSAKEVKYGLTSTEFILSTKEGEMLFELPIIGEFNLYNSLGVIAIAREKGISLEEIQRRLRTYRGVSGRMEVVNKDSNPTIIVDFAHTADALEKVLSNLKKVTPGRLITLFGCGGDRDRQKRPEMAKVAEKYSDFVIVTADNSRNEPIEKILEEICRGFSRKKYLIEPDRRQAISLGVNMLNENDTLLIAGKGHEKKQIFAHKTIDFDDVKVAKEMLDVLPSSLL